MDVDFGWFLPTMGDGEAIGPPSREPTLDYLVQVAQAAEEAFLQPDGPIWAQLIGVAREREGAGGTGVDCWM